MSRARAEKTEPGSGAAGDVIVQNLRPTVRTPDPVRLCFCAYVTRLTVFVSLRVIVCHRLCERLSVSAAGRTCACTCV